MITIDTQKRDLWQELVYSLSCIRSDETYESFAWREKPIEITATGSTAAVTVDLKSEAFVDIMQSRSSPVNTTRTNLFIVQDWEKILIKLNALDDIIGMYAELSEEQQRGFDEAIKRRPLFK